MEAKEAETKEKLHLYDFLAARIAGYVLDGKHVKPVEECFPGLFKKEVSELREEKTKRELEVNKAKMLAFAEFHNKQRKEVLND